MFPIVLLSTYYILDVEDAQMNEIWSCSQPGGRDRPVSRSFQQSDNPRTAMCLHVQKHNGITEEEVKAGGVTGLITQE